MVEKPHLRVYVFLAVGVLLAGVASVYANTPTILLVSDCSAPGTYTEEPPNDVPERDNTLVSFLEGLGYTVDTSGMNQAYREEQDPFNDPNTLAALNAADLVLVSRHTNSGYYSGYYGGNDRQNWNELEKPLLLMNGYMMRGGANNRWGWGTGDGASANNTTTDIIIEAGQAGHPFVAGLPSPIIAFDWSESTRWVFLPNSPLVAGADVIGTFDGMPILIDIPAGTNFDDPNNTGGPYGIAGGRRALLATWSYDTFGGIFTDFLTPDYLDLLAQTLNELAPITVATIYVDDDAPGANNGSDWENAFIHLQDALSVAEPCDTILVVQGLYKPDVGGAFEPGDRTASFQLKDGVAIKGGYAGYGTPEPNDRNIDLYKSILSGDLDGNDIDVNDPCDLLTEPTRGENSYHVVMGSGTDANTVLDGFTIKGGIANGSFPDNQGGGMYNDSSNPMITNCTFSSNSSVEGGGMYNTSSSPTVTNCTFSGNSAAPWGTYGGGMRNWNSNPILTGCTFSGNSAGSGGGGISGGNGAITNCTFTGNTAGNDGGGMASAGGAITNCTFSGNSAGWGGGMFNHGGSSTVTGCTFSGNDANNYGGGMYIEGGFSVVLTNCIVWGNTAPSGPQIYGSATVNYSDVQGGWGGEGNINANPWFVDPDNPVVSERDYHLQLVSPCINRGDPNRSYGGQTDIDGEPRVMGGRVDMGSDEVAVEIDSYYVDDNAPLDPGPGDADMSDPDEDGSWQHPFDSIQEAIDAAQESQLDVLVLDGVYTGFGNRNINLPGQAMTVRSENGPASCIIDCEQQGIGFRFVYEQGHESVIDGFTVTNGLYDDEGWGGGGILCRYSSPTIVNCIFAGNESEGGGHGGGIYLAYSDTTLRNCVIRNNIAGEPSGGGIYVHNSSVTLEDCKISKNEPEGIVLDGSDASVVGTVEIISDSATGGGTFYMEEAAVLDMNDCRLSCNVVGQGTIHVPFGKELVVEGDAVVNLDEPSDPNGVIECDGLLKVTDTAALIDTTVNVTRAIFEKHAVVTGNVFTTNALIPYGQIAVEDMAVFSDNDIFTNGDRHIDVEPEEFGGAIEDARIFVTVSEGQNDTRGGLFELRGEDVLCEDPCCEPGLIGVPEVPDFNMVAWTAERIELLAGSKLTLTNRDDYQEPYDSNGENEVLYVKQLVLGPDSVLDVAFNRVYYETLEKDESAIVISQPLLGFSLDDIVFADVDEFSSRVISNNTFEPEEPNKTRVHVERVLGHELDPSGVMVMRSVLDLDQTSPTYGRMVYAHTKGLFAKCREEEVLIRFKYLFETTEPLAELRIYLSDVPYLLDPNDPNFPLHSRKVGVLPAPPAPRPGSAGSGRFGVFEKTVPTEGLDLTDGTYVELELYEPEKAQGFMVLAPLLEGLMLELEEGDGGVIIDEWGPEVHCDGICLDITWDELVDEIDFLTVIGECGCTAELDPNDTLSRACLEGAFSDDGFVDALDVAGWDWTLGSAERKNLCDGVPLSEGGEGASLEGEHLEGAGGPKILVSLPSDLNDLLIMGKRNAAAASTKLKDRLYVFDSNGQYVEDFEPNSVRSNVRVVPGSDGQLYQVNLDSGVVRLDATDKVIIPPGQRPYANEPRYNKSATVYVGLQVIDSNYVGRPIFDAAIDGNYAYVVPVVVNPDGNESYAAAAKLKLFDSNSPPYDVVMVYDDAPLPGDNQYRNNLREIEIDEAGNAYVINVHSLNESDILWRYEPNGAFERVELGKPSDSNYIPDPMGMYMSDTADMLFLASAQYNPSDVNSTVVHGFSTDGALKIARSITINGMQHVTSITEDAVTGTLYVVGFNMEEIPLNPNPTIEPFYDPCFAKVPYDSNSVTAQPLSGSHDLALPMSIVWTGTEEVKCGGADLNGSGTVNLVDLAYLGNYWLKSNCGPLEWCGKADINMSKKVNMGDVAIIAEYWLKDGCAD